MAPLYANMDQAPLLPFFTAGRHLGTFQKFVSSLSRAKVNNDGRLIDMSLSVIGSAKQYPADALLGVREEP